MKRFFKSLWGILPGIAVLILLLAVNFFCFGSLFRSCASFVPDPVLITEQAREDGAYTVKLWQTGAPFLLGPTPVALTLHDASGRQVWVDSFYVPNDGGPAEPQNLLSIVWDDSGATVTMKGMEGGVVFVVVLPYPSE